MSRLVQHTAQGSANRTATQVRGAVQDLFTPFTLLMHTLTFDNGKEFNYRTLHEVFSGACRAAGISPPPVRPDLCPF